MDPFQNVHPAAQYPTWHERAYAPGTPESMYMMLQDEARVVRVSSGTPSGVSTTRPSRDT